MSKDSGLEGFLDWLKSNDRTEEEKMQCKLLDEYMKSRQNLPGKSITGDGPVFFYFASYGYLCRSCVFTIVFFLEERAVREDSPFSDFTYMNVNRYHLIAFTHIAYKSFAVPLNRPK